MARRCCLQGLVVPKVAKLVEAVPVLEAVHTVAEQARSIAPVGTKLTAMKGQGQGMKPLALGRVPVLALLLEPKLALIVPACCRCNRDKL